MAPDLTLLAKNLLAKPHANIDIDEDNKLVDIYLEAAYDFIEDSSRRSLLSQTWELTLDSFPCQGYIELPRPPLVSITSVQYKDINGATQTFNSSNYIVDNKSDIGCINLKSTASWPSVSSDINAVTVTYTAGYGAITAIPQKLKQAIRMLFAHFYENRESVSYYTLKEVPSGVEALVAPHRITKWCWNEETYSSW